MNIWRLIFREILHRKFNFGLGVFSVLIAVGVLVAQLTLLKAHDARTQSILAQKEAKTREEMKAYEDSVRVLTKNMGFNILILPEGQELGDFYAEGYASQYMPEDYVEKLANSNILTVRHLLPSLEQKIKWPEQKRTIVLMGTRGEVPLAHLDPKKPIQDAVPPGMMVVGYELANSLRIGPGEQVQLLGETFTVSECHPERGTKDDITVWIDLATAQKLLDKQGQINAILALKCHCAGNDLPAIRSEVARILPGTKVVEFGTRAIARAEARDRATALAVAALEAERDNQAKLRRQREDFAAWFVPVVLLGCVAWIAFLALGNVRERRSEIGILRALGLRSAQIFFVFILRAALLGILGAVLGYIAGVLFGALNSGLEKEIRTTVDWLDPRLLVVILIGSPLLAAFASWVPALAAARQDPANILHSE